MHDIGVRANQNLAHTVFRQERRLRRWGEVSVELGRSFVSGVGLRCDDRRRLPVRCRNRPDKQWSSSDRDSNDRNDRRQGPNRAHSRRVHPEDAQILLDERPRRRAADRVRVYRSFLLCSRRAEKRSRFGR